MYTKLKQESWGDTQGKCSNGCAALKGTIFAVYQLHYNCYSYGPIWSDVLDKWYNKTVNFVKF